MVVLRINASRILIIEVPGGGGKTNSVNRPTRPTASHAARVPAMISASHVDNATDCCFFMPQPIAASDSTKL
eukprot:1219033-Pleurochrysis_carterae.AAC.1